MKSSRTHLPIDLLPVHKCPESCKTKLFEQLDNDLLKAVETLPERTSELNWEDFKKTLKSGEGLIEDAKFDSEGETRMNSRRFSQLLKVAASLSFIILFFSLLLLEDRNQTDISWEISEGITFEQKIDISQFKSEDDKVLILVNARCHGELGICYSEEFVQLMEHYMDLKNSRQALVKEFKSHPESAQLANYLVRLEKKRIEVGKKLLKHLV